MRIGAFFENNLMAILAGALALYSGYVTGQSDVRSKIEKIADQVADLKQAQARQRTTVGCIAWHVMRFEAGSKEPTPCPLMPE